jgi:hypothetical protein
MIIRTLIVAVKMTHSVILISHLNTTYLLSLGESWPSLNTYLSSNTFQYFLNSFAKLSNFCVIDAQTGGYKC